MKPFSSQDFYLSGLLSLEELQIAPPDLESQEETQGLGFRVLGFRVSGLGFRV